MKKLFISFLMFLFSFIALSYIQVQAASPIGTSFNFSIETKIGNNEAIVTNLGSKTYGSTVTIDAGTYNTSNEFVTYIVNNKIEPTLPANHTFIVTGDLEITAIYKPVDTIAVSFLDANQDLLATQFVTSGGSVTPPDISGLTKPGYVVSETPWSGAYNNPTVDTVVWVQYVSNIADTFTVTVNNGSADKTSYAYNEVATVTASGTGNFQYWYMNGNIVSLHPTYSFTVLANTALTAVYTGEATGSIPETLFISLSDSYSLKTNYSTYVGQFYLPSGHEMVEFGLIASDTQGNINLDTAGVVKLRSNKYNPVTGEFVSSLLDATYSTKNIRAYMITTDGVSLSTTYSFVNENLFISEYGEGTGTNKWIEIYNPNNYVVDLSRYSLSLFSGNVTTASSTEEFVGKTIGAKDVFVIYNTSSNPLVISQGDLANNGVINFNGDDEVALYKDNYIIDVIGFIGATGEFVKDVTLTRKETVTTSNYSWNISDWDSKGVDTFTEVGIHKPTNPSMITITGATTVMVGSTINLSVTYPPNTINGVTWSIESGTAATVNSSGVVTGGSEGTVTVKATSTADTNITDTHIVEVIAPVSYTVTYMSDGSQFTQQTNILSGSTTDAPDPAPTKTGGFTFDGWYRSADGGATLGAKWVFASDTVTDNTTLYAKWISSTSEVLLYSYNFLDGGSSSNNAYANTNLSTNVSYAADNPGGTSGTTPWIADYANLSLTNATRLGGKLVSTEYGDPSANIATGFAFTKVITKVELLGAATFGTAGNVGNIYLQTSTDGSIWTTIGTKTVSSTITFDSLNIPVNSYLRIVVQLKASGTNSGLAFTGIKVTGLPE